MLILGFQKMTLLDFPNKVACTIFTGGCNLRCPFCHNAKLVTEINAEEKYSKEEILAFLSKRKGLLDGVCITGGEPLIQDGIKDFTIMIKEMGFKVKLDTNGFYPDKLKELVNEKLVDYVAVDVKNSPEKYAETVGVKNIDLAPFEESVNFLLKSDLDYEFRTTVVKEYHEVEDIEKIAELIRGAEKYFLQNFVDSGNLIGNDLHAHEKEILLKMKEAAKKHGVSAEIRGI
ncbi:MAG: anaerobic ribonucleoside-triphosphate reductase activating protein [Clostridia bacterium]|nr:anaerobic ribonucleoside-triphosphate reductase activating protein [Clostridia bacterium]